MATFMLVHGACTGGFADCNGNKQIDGCEVNTTTDHSNCGACGAACSNSNIASPTFWLFSG